MILRRFMKHVTDQNWFAVGLDVLVVITGIFLGMQVQEIYGQRDDRHTEQVYLNRLHTEVVQNLGFNSDNFSALLLLENFQQNERKLDEVLAAFDGQGALTGLTPRHCLAIMSSAIYNDQQTYLPTLSELLASGQLSIIESEVIKIALSEYTLAFGALKQQVVQYLNSRTNLFQKYPEFVVIDRKMRSVAKVDEINHLCDFEAMQAHNAFNIDLTIAASKLHYFNLILANQQESLLKVHRVLDGALDISHPEKAQ
jgi:hypothetical protein